MTIDTTQMPVVKTAHLHAAVMMAGVIGGEKTLSEFRVKGIQMWDGGETLYVKVKGRWGGVPKANIALMEYDMDGTVETTKPNRPKA